MSLLNSKTRVQIPPSPLVPNIGEYLGMFIRFSENFEHERTNLLDFSQKMTEKRSFYVFVRTTSSNAIRKYLQAALNF